MADAFLIKNGYRINPRPSRYLDSEADALTYQVDVYGFAADQVEAGEVRSVLDVGCGFGSKLAALLQSRCSDIVGIDEGHAITYCQRQHPFGRWYEDDIEHPRLELDRSFDLIISADVIEHLVNPDLLLRYLKRFTHPGSRFVVSTPERDLRRGIDDNGPPANSAHVREWNQHEFAAYLRSRGVRILEHRIMDLKAGMRTCQTVLGQFGD